MSLSRGGKGDVSVRSSFEDYHLIVDDSEDACRTPLRPHLPSMEDLAAGISLQRQVLYSNSGAAGAATTSLSGHNRARCNSNAAAATENNNNPHVAAHVATEIYFDEDTTLPSRDEAAPQEEDDDLEEALLSPNDRHDQHHHHHGRHAYHGSSRRQLYYSSSAAPLTRKNILNAVTYAVHVFVAGGIGIWGLNGTIATRWQITTKYACLVTPAPWAYHLWVRTCVPYVLHGNVLLFVVVRCCQCCSLVQWMHRFLTFYILDLRFCGPPGSHFGIGRMLGHGPIMARISQSSHYTRWY